MLPVFKEYIQFLKDKTNNDDKTEVSFQDSISYGSSDL